jgi:hypothetical protein
LIYMDFYKFQKKSVWQKNSTIRNNPKY